MTEDLLVDEFAVISFNADVKTPLRVVYLSLITYYLLHIFIANFHSHLKVNDRTKTEPNYLIIVKQGWQRFDSKYLNFTKLFLIRITYYLLLIRYFLLFTFFLIY